MQPREEEKNASKFALRTNAEGEKKRVGRVCIEILNQESRGLGCGASSTISLACLD